MFIGNVIIFIVTVVIVCLVDFSTITLDESTERLLYSIEETGDKGTAEESESQIEPELKPEPEFVDSESLEFDSEVEPPVSPEPVKNNKTSKRSKRNTTAKQETVSDVDDVGYSVDFQDDFASIDNSVEEIYEKGGGY